jgi:hypothetical protein
MECSNLQSDYLGLISLAARVISDQNSTTGALIETSIVSTDGGDLQTYILQDYNKTIDRNDNNNNKRGTDPNDNNTQ